MRRSDRASVLRYIFISRLVNIKFASTFQDDSKMHSTCRATWD